MQKINNSNGCKIIKQDGVKNNLLRYLYSKVNISNFTYKMLEFDTDLNELLREKYFVSANFSGTPCFLIFFMYNDKYYSFIVDKKKLSYSTEKLNSENVEIFPVKLKLDNSIYSGTIFDGIYIKKNKKNKSDMFVITDVHLLKGSENTMSINIKMKLIFEFLKNNYDCSQNNDLLLSVNLLFELNKIESLLNDTIPILEYSVRGLCFYPNKSGKKLIYLFSNENNNNHCSNKLQSNRINFNNSKKNTLVTLDTNTENCVEMESEEEIEKKEIFMPGKKSKGTKFIFEMKGDDKPDIYHLYVVEPIENKDKTKIKLKRRKVDLAYIPNIKKSKWCKDLMDESEENSVLVECDFDSEKNKWIPNKKVDVKRPSYASEFNIVEKYIND